MKKKLIILGLALVLLSVSSFGGYKVYYWYAETKIENLALNCLVITTLGLGLIIDKDLNEFVETTYRCSKNDKLVLFPETKRLIKRALNVKTEGGKDRLITDLDIELNRVRLKYEKSVDGE